MGLLDGGVSAASLTLFPVTTPPPSSMPVAHICAVCRQPLSFTQQWDGGVEMTAWVHSGPVDHETQPVPRVESDEARLQPVCDFCGTQSDVGTSWVYPARAFEMTGANETESLTQVDDGEGWGACARCHRLIEADQRDALATRAANIAMRRQGLEAGDERAFQQMMGAVRQAHELFFATRSGPAFPAREFTGPQG